MDANRELAERFITTLEARDWAAWAGLLHPDVVYEIPQSRERIRGRDRYLLFNQEYPGDWHLRPKITIADERHAVVWFEWRLGGRTDDAMVFFDFADGLITRVTDFWPEPYEPPPGREHLVERWLPQPSGNTRGMALTTRMLTPETWDDFAALVEANNGVWGGCWCIGFHPEGVGHGREGNRELKRQHVTGGTVHQVLVYDGDRCVGWCQFGPPAEVATINNAKAYEKDLADLPDWRIGCIFTNGKDRGKGVAAAAVAAALDEIRRAGGGVVEAYPEQTAERPPQRGAYLHTGPEELYARYGFTRVRKIAKWRWVMRASI